MDKKTITIDGRDYPVVFNMGTMMNFEEIAQKPFIGESFKLLRDRSALILSAVLSADEDTDANIRAIAACSDWQAFNEAFITVIGMAAGFFRIPSALTEEGAREHDAGGGAKNPPPPTTSTE